MSYFEVGNSPDVRTVLWQRLILAYHGGRIAGQNCAEPPEEARKAPAYKPKNASLGRLELLPAEIRLSIFEIALEIDRPITPRKCCGILDDNKTPCEYHGKALKQKTSRFALLSTSRDVRHDALWVLHNKIKVYADITNIMLMERETALLEDWEWEPFELMWASISKYRLLELTIPGAIIRYGQPDHFTASLRDGIGQLCRERHASAERVLETTIHLGRLFNETLPFNTDEVKTARGKEYTSLMETSWENLEQSVELIALMSRNAKWTFTAMSEIEADNEMGQAFLDNFQTLLAANGIAFQGKSAVEVPIADAIESKSATGGTHRRFFD